MFATSFFSGNQVLCTVQYYCMKNYHLYTTLYILASIDQASKVDMLFFLTSAETKKINNFAKRRTPSGDPRFPMGEGFLLWWRNPEINTRESILLALSLAPN